MKFIHIRQNDSTELVLNLDHVSVVQLSSSHAYISLIHYADKIMIPAVEWERISVYFPPKQFPRVAETAQTHYLVNLENVTHITVTSSFSYLFVRGFSEKIMLKAEVWADISILFPCQ
ncbi:hypothetical protein QQ054_14550 [Oscillatoria amoena NRMC-F 0135]|nr:hypothetical protein [Oscillatoria laete-virens]MDL5047242.1 hypothetical protein [Oscillatoria amoena NRMC-F 0135]MDL5052526.1 hypothetical protein [Oscillatoria laete-virens NRMC-F 0139]